VVQLRCLAKQGDNGSQVTQASEPHILILSLEVALLTGLGKTSSGFISLLKDLKIANKHSPGGVTSTKATMNNHLINMSAFWDIHQSAAPLLDVE